MGAQLALVPEPARGAATILREFKARAHRERAACEASLAVDAEAEARACGDDEAAAALRSLASDYRSTATEHAASARLLLAPTR